MTNLRGKTVFVTGGASGIGAETARLLIREGASVVLVDIDEKSLRAIADELGDNALPIVADVRDLDAMTKAATSGIERFGGIDLVLANAGIASYGSIARVDPEAFRRVLDINLLGVFHTVRATLPAVIERKGYILLVSSLAAFVASPSLGSYNTSKAGVEQFANTLRLEQAANGVGVGCTHMTVVNTPLIRETMSDIPAFDDLIAILPPPLNRIVPVEECARAFVAGLDKRKRRVYVPGSVRLLGWARMLLTARAVERALRSRATGITTKSDHQVVVLGRSLSERNERLGKQ